MPRTRLVAVDGLRDLAVLLVLMHHFVELQLPREIGSGQAHLPLARATVGGLPMAAFGYTALGLLCTAVSWRLLEARLIALGRRFTYRLSPSSQPALPSLNPS